MGKRYRITLPAFAALLFLHGNAWAFCATPEEMSALNDGALQSQLMVAALSCGQEAEYNRFVKKFGKALVSSSKKVQDYFRRHYAKRAESELNRFITRMANLSSRGSMATPRQQYCESSEKLFKKTLALSGKQFRNYSEKSQAASLHGIKPCGSMAALSAGYSWE